SVYLWIVPARIGETWTFRDEGGAHEFELTLEQTFQMLCAPGGDRSVMGRLAGRAVEIEFALSGEAARLTGTVDAAGDVIDAVVTRGGESVRYRGTRG